MPLRPQFPQFRRAALAVPIAVTVGLTVNVHL